MAIEDFFTDAVLFQTVGMLERQGDVAPHSLNAQVETPRRAAWFEVSL